MINRLSLNLQKNSVSEEIEELTLSGEKLPPPVKNKTAEITQNESEDIFQEYIEEDFSESFFDDTSSLKESDENGLDKEEFKEVLSKTKGALDAVNMVGYDNFFNKVDIDNDDIISKYELNLLNSNGQTGSVSYDDIMESVNSMSSSVADMTSENKNIQADSADNSEENVPVKESEEREDVKNVDVDSPKEEVKTEENNTTDVQNNDDVITDFVNDNDINSDNNSDNNSVDDEKNSTFSYGETSSSDNTSGDEEGGTIDSLNEQVEKLSQEKEETEEDLEQNNENYSETQEEKETEISNMDSEISSSEEDLGQAQNDEQTAQDEVTVAQDEVESAQEKVQEDKESVDENEANVNEANENVQNSNQNADIKNEANQNAINEENAAQGDYNSANSDLSNAINDTAAAQSTSNEASNNLVAAEGETATAFNVFNQKQEEVEEAQREYDAAQATQNDKNWWDQFCDWVGNLWNSLADAIQGRDASERELEEKQQEEYEKRIISEEAEEALNEKREEQDTAQDVADSASVILARKTGEREVSDQEYADALLDLASSMSAKDKAEGEYSTALEEYMSANDYKVNAEGNLTDKNGQLIDIKTVVGELEDFLEIKNATKTEKESSYNQVLETTVEVIKGDETKISSLSTEIENLQTKIQEEKEKIALEEEMINQLEMERAEAEAEKEGAGFFDHVWAMFGGSYNGSKNTADEKRKLLEEALCSGDDTKIQEAYRKLNEDKEVAIDEKGNVVDTSGMSDEELKKCTKTTVGELSDKQIKSYTKNEAKTAYESEKITNFLKNDGFVYNGQTVSLEDIQSLLEKQANKMMSDLDDKTKQQGWLSQGVGFINNGLGIGTSENESRAQIQAYKEMVQDLKNCKDPAQFASKYKALTGNNFDVSAISSLLAYGEIKNSDKTSGTKNTKANSNAIDLTETVDGIVKNVNDNADGDSDVLLQTRDSKANESIQDYVESQKTLTDSVTGLITGVVTAVAVALTPFTGGASLLLGAGIGAALNVGLNASNSIYDSDGNGSIDFNYSFEQGAKDFVLGAINGAVGIGANNIGATITESLGKSLVKDSIATTFKQAAKNTIGNVASKLVGSAVEGAVDGGLSSMGGYAIEAMTNDDVDFNFGDMLTAGGQGALMGSAMNVGMTGISAVGGKIMKSVSNKAFKNALNEALEGTTGKNTLAEILADKLDDDLIVDNKVNKYAVEGLRKTSEEAFAALKKAGISESDIFNTIKKTDLSDIPNLTEKAEKLIKNFQKASISDNEAKSIVNELGLDNAEKFIDVYNGLKKAGYSKDDVVTIVKNSSDSSPKELIDDASKILTKSKNSIKGLQDGLEKGATDKVQNGIQKVSTDGVQDGLEKGAEDGVQSSKPTYSKPELDKYKIHEVSEILNEQQFKSNYAQANNYEISSDGAWAYYSPNSQHSAWKMHVFTDSVDDLANLDSVLKYLRDNNINHKFTGPDQDFAYQTSGIQSGKGITIYPTDVAQMEQLAKDLDYIIKNNGLCRLNTEIHGDNMMGDSGRLFYRYEFQSGSQANDILDLSNPTDYDNYLNNYYKANDSTDKDSYLAPDMNSATDDPWLNFDPSDPASKFGQ